MPFKIGHKHSKKTRHKISLSNLKNPNRYWLGKTIPKSTRLKISNTLKGSIPWNKGKKETRSEVLERQSKSHIGKKQSKSTKIKRGIFNKEEKASHWLGDGVGYWGVHQWVRRVKGNASDYTCSCGKQAKHWSNKDHSYKRILKDYIAMCVSCHRKYDYKHNLKEYK